MYFCEANVVFKTDHELFLRWLFDVVVISRRRSAKRQAQPVARLALAIIGEK